MINLSSKLSRVPERKLRKCFRAVTSAMLHRSSANAVSVGLIDEIGGLYSAINKLDQMTQVVSAPKAPQYHSKYQTPGYYQPNYQRQSGYPGHTGGLQ